VLAYSYANLRTKSPDSQFTPKSIQVPPAVIRPGTTTLNYAGMPFPTVVFECSHNNESWPTLLHDARSKAFSRNTLYKFTLASRFTKRSFGPCGDEGVPGDMVCDCAVLRASSQSTSRHVSRSIFQRRSSSGGVLQFQFTYKIHPTSEYNSKNSVGS
jgi:hypothetical protein